MIAHHISQPINDDRYIVVQLDFEDVARAATFLDILRTDAGPTRLACQGSTARRAPSSFNPPSRPAALTPPGSDAE